MTEPTGREFDMLRAQVDAQRSRLNDIDDHGTKGVAGLHVQMTELVKDVLELKADMSVRFTSHDRVHEVDAASRVSARRWLVGTGIAAMLSLATVVGLLFDIITRLH